MGKMTKEERLLELMGDGRWHSGRELALKVSHRFGGYLFTMKEKGIAWEKRMDPERPAGERWYDYRLVKPDTGDFVCVQDCGRCDSDIAAACHADEATPAEQAEIQASFFANCDPVTCAGCGRPGVIDALTKDGGQTWYCVECYREGANRA